MRGFLKDVLDGKVREVRKWLEKGEVVSQYDEYGNTALHLAAEKGYRGVCKVLLDAGADVNQSNVSVGWTGLHYAAYEGHTDVLRMLLAHGAIPDIPDKSGDTAESYAAEWENMECVKILREATAARKAARDTEEMFESDGSLEDSDEDDDDDESSMMNWIMPPPSIPNRQVNVAPVLSADLPVPASVVKAPNDSTDDIQLSVHLNLPPSNLKPETVSDARVESVRVGGEQNGNIESDSDTESEDTLVLIQKSKAIKASRDRESRVQQGSATPCSMSIVDKIKNTLSLSSQTSQTSQTINNHHEGEICSAGDNGANHVKESLPAPPLSGRSNFRETTCPRELLPLADHIFSLSSATIPEDLTMSCTSVFDKFAGENSESEKEVLLKRLKELFSSEENQVDRDLHERKVHLSVLETEFLKKTNELKAILQADEVSLLERQSKELSSLKSAQVAEEERIEREILKLEAELESILAPARLLTSLATTEPGRPPEPSRAREQRAELCELETELQCGGCGRVCAPPRQIFQCPEGDLLCEDCRDPGPLTCPVCSCHLAPGLLSRNKVLENIARKYFKQK